MTGQNRREESPAARVGLGKMESRPRRTQWWSSWGSGWSDWGFSAEQLLRRRRRMAEAALRRWIGDNKWGKSLTGAR